MRVAAIDGRLCLGTDQGWVDVAVSSGRRRIWCAGVEQVPHR